ncbi:MAG TPA: hypothetical protein VLT59_12330 [Steroidobacteraceae bacterium]|nr:hypothetical protein [Steroidobacteraceae bacterium]
MSANTLGHQLIAAADVAALRRDQLATVERLLLGAILLLVLLHIATIAPRIATPAVSPVYLWQIASLRTEAGVGTWFAVLLLAFGGLLAGAVAGRCFDRRDRVWRWWALLGVCLLGASLEEVVGLHEQLDRTLTLDTGELTARITYQWILVGAPLAALLGIVFARFLFTRRPGVRWRLFTGGCLYVLGAVGIEILGGALAAGEATKVALELSYALEEALELTGAALVTVGVARELAAG